MVTGGAQQHAAQSTKMWMPSIRLSDPWRLLEQLKTMRELICEEVWGRRAVGSPPSINGPYLSGSFRFDYDRKTHRRARNSLIISDAGRPLPFSMDSCARVST